MQSHGASAAGDAFWGVAIGIGLYMFLTLKSRAFTQNGDRPISMGGRPLLYWGLQTGLAMIVVLLLVFGWHVSMSNPVHIRSGGG